MFHNEHLMLSLFLNKVPLNHIHVAQSRIGKKS